MLLLDMCSDISQLCGRFTLPTSTYEAKQLMSILSLEPLGPFAARLLVPRMACAGSAASALHASIRAQARAASPLAVFMLTMFVDLTSSEASRKGQVDESLSDAQPGVSCQKHETLESAVERDYIAQRDDYKITCKTTPAR